MTTLKAGFRNDIRRQSRKIAGGKREAASALPVSRGHPDIRGVALARLLIVDDDADQVEASCRLLGAQGYLATGATSGRHALDILHAAVADGIHFDVLITDLMMPVMDGVALLHAARDIDRDLVLIVMTGHGTIGTAVEAMKSGALDYILKPFDLDVTMSVLSRALAVRRLAFENAALLQQVENRTTELEEANRELRAANKELDAFTRSVSHDLRQPLTNIIGFAELLSKEITGPLNDKQKEFFGYIHSGGKHLLRLTEDLLQFSRWSQQPLSKLRVDMETLVWEILRPMQAAEAHRHVELRVGRLPDVSGDPSLLRQVFMNLLSNAFKFTRNVSNPIIEVTGELDSGKVNYCIRDNGAGFDMVDAKRLFSIFQRLHSDVEFEGTGVGLSIVQRILKRHGGTIWAESVAGQGAAFTFALPR
jgi:two-component system sensor histidine kinase/response regulator